MQILKLIKFLKRTAEKLKAYAVKQEERKLEQASEAYDYAGELAEKRIANAERIAQLLIDRACAKEGNDIAKANENRAKAACALELLETV